MTTNRNDLLTSATAVSETSEAPTLGTLEGSIKQQQPHIAPTVQTQQAQQAQSGKTVLLAEEIEGAAVGKAESVTVLGIIKTILNALLGTSATHSLDLKNSRAVLGGINTSSMNIREKLFKGFGQNLTTNFVRGGILFGTMPVIQQAVTQQLRPDQRMLAEGIAFVFASVIEGVSWTPFSYANLQIATTPAKSYREVFRTADPKTLWKAIKKGAFWGGFVRNSMFGSMFFPSLKYCESRFISEDDPLSTKMLKTIPLAAVSGLFPSVLSYPFDVISKRSMQAPHLSIKEIGKALYENNGLKGFWAAFYTVPARMLAYSGALGTACVVAPSIYNSSATLFGGSQRLKTALTQASVAPTEEEVRRDLATNSFSNL